MTEDPFFHRPQYANDLAQQLLKPTALQLQVRSGVFLSGIRRIGKTTFLRQDLIPALESMLRSHCTHFLQRHNQLYPCAGVGH
jgi:hypothetical protein